MLHDALVDLMRWSRSAITMETASCFICPSILQYIEAGREQGMGWKAIEQNQTYNKSCDARQALSSLQTCSTLQIHITQPSSCNNHFQYNIHHQWSHFTFAGVTGQDVELKLSSKCNLHILKDRSNVINSLDRKLTGLGLLCYLLLLYWHLIFSNIWSTLADGENIK